MNFTQADDKKWRSLSNDAIYTNQKLLGMVYQHKLACTVQQLDEKIISGEIGKNEIWIVTQADKLTNKEAFDLFTSYARFKSKSDYGWTTKRKNFS
jgi:hypothetical protein